MYSTAHLKEQTVNVPAPQIQSHTTSTQSQRQTRDEDTDVKIVVKATKHGSGFKDHVKITIKAVTLLPMDRICVQESSEEQMIDSIERKIRHLLDAVKIDDDRQSQERRDPERYKVRMEVHPIEGEGEHLKKEYETERPPTNLRSQESGLEQPIGRMNLGDQGSRQSGDKAEEASRRAEELAKSDAPPQEKFREGVGMAKEKLLGSRDAPTGEALRKSSAETTSRLKSAVGAGMTAFEADNTSAARRISKATPQDLRSDVPVEPVTHKTKDDAPGNIPERVKAAVSAAVHALKGDQ